MYKITAAAVFLSTSAYDNHLNYTWFIDRQAKKGLLQASVYP